MLTDRVAKESYIIKPENASEKEVIVDPGTIIWLPSYPMHMDPKYYPHPEVFDPERFSDENKANMNPFTYFPFGLGPRVCIGTT